NRMRPLEFVTLFEAAGFELCAVHESQVLELDDATFAGFAPRFRALPRRQLEVAGATFHLRLRSNRRMLTRARPVHRLPAMPAGSPERPFRSVWFDCDSTLTAVEGIDELGALRGPEVRARVARATERAMAGELPLAAVYGERLREIAPTRAECEAL